MVSITIHVHFEIVYVNVYMGEGVRGENVELPSYEVKW